MEVGATAGGEGQTRKSSTESSQNSQVARCALIACVSASVVASASHCNNDSFVGQARVLAKRECDIRPNPLDHNRPASTKITTTTEGKHK